MARKSRQNLQLAKAHNQSLLDAASVKPAIRTGIYARLSLYDMNHLCRDSMQNQIHLLESYMEKHPELNLTDRYIDNGWSGMNFDRPAFKRLIEDIENGKINCIVVKDLSRFGRNYVETGYYLETKFPTLGVRFIAINDDFDTKTAKPDDLGIILKNISNDFFSRDLSRRYAASYDIRTQKGVFRHGIPYGYMYDPERPDYLIFNPEVSHYVHLIFQWALEGMATHKIAEQLKAMNVPTQERLEYLRNDGKTKHEGGCKWDTVSVRAMLLNPVYAGDFVYGKVRNRKCDPYNNRIIPKEDWTIIPDVFPAYISHEQQAILEKRLDKNVKKFHQDIKRKKTDHEKIPDYYMGLIYCSICGRKVHTSLDIRKKSQSYLMYFCHQYGNSLHPEHRVSIHKKMLDTIVLDEIQDQLRLAEHYSQWLLSSTGQNDANKWLHKQQDILDNLNLLKKQNKTEQTDTFERYADAEITDETFRLQMNELQKQERSLAEAMEKQAIYIQEIQTALSTANPWLQLMTQISYTDRLTKQLTHTLIECIVLGPELEVNITFHEEHWYHLLFQSYEEIQKELSSR